MATQRKFCRFNKRDSISPGKADDSGVSVREVPEGGFCLSAFLVLVQRENTDAVLMGRINPDAPWDHIGALDESRISIFSGGWMLPSSHLLLHESPQDAASRIGTEQLELRGLKLSEPKVVSEVYISKRFPDRPDHWDIEFIFKGTLGKDEVPKSESWNELKFIEVERTQKSEIARSHEDILEHAGLKFASN